MPRLFVKYLFSIPSLFLMLCLPVAAAPDFPALSGRVVDEADVISAQAEAEISAQLAAHEKASGNQLVVVTLKSLRGYDISDYGYQLGRHWGIGQKGKNNGALLIVAPNERKMRIEVGYGLEGLLTDATSRDIIERIIKPYFRQQNYDQGVRAGVSAILEALGGNYQPAPPPVTAAEKTPQGTDWWFLLPLFFFMIPTARGLLGGRFGGNRAGAPRVLMGTIFGSIMGVITGIIFSSLVVGAVIGVVVMLFTAFSSGGGGGSSWGSGGSSSGGGFSGGGGSFGGGGASGDW